MRLLTILVPALLLTACNGGSTGVSDLCSNTFEPYPDLITGRVIQNDHLGLLHGMEAYSAGRYQEAADSLSAYLEKRVANKAAHLYLANAYLALGKPFDAELQLDHLENSNLTDYRDQTEWYTVVCWLCSDQLDRARSGAERIAKGRRHTYQKEAALLVEALEQ